MRGNARFRKSARRGRARRGNGSAWDCSRSKQGPGYGRFGTKKGRKGTALGPLWDPVFYRVPGGSWPKRRPGRSWVAEGWAKHFFRCYAFGVRLHLELKANVERRTPKYGAQLSFRRWLNLALPLTLGLSHGGETGPEETRGDQTGTCRSCHPDSRQ